jgi:N-acetylglucosaminyldiphosphoundecaprenol N-acetyl-beta-D-mannosaminyltransferase
MDSNTAVADDLSREVYCILGIPIDAIEMPAALRRIEAAAAGATPLLISTPNVNFLVNCEKYPDFRDSLLLSDLCPADGLPIVWIARLMGIPIKKRVAGSDIFEALKSRPISGHPLKIFLFGATERVAVAAYKQLNYNQVGLKCIGWICPGFGDMDALSDDHFINEINSSGADFLVAALGARKGQLWLQRNHRRLRVPIRAHLGAVINFQAGTVKRAPEAMRKLGLEWLWRIKEEPTLWRRYWHDGGVMLRLLLSRVVPLAIFARWLKMRTACRGHDFVIVQANNDLTVTLSLSGYATVQQIPEAISCFRGALESGKPVVLDLSETWAADSRFFGLLLMLRKQLMGRGDELRLIGVSSGLQRQFRLNGLGYLLRSNEDHEHHDFKSGS